MLDAPVTHFQLTNAFAKIRCEPSWKWAKRDKPIPNFDLFYVWEGIGELMLNNMSYPLQKGSCFLFRPGDFTSAIHDAQFPLTLTYIHFRMAEKPAHIPMKHRILTDTKDVETLLTRYVRVRLNNEFGAEQEAQLIIKQLMIHLLRADQKKDTKQKGQSNQLHEVIQEIANYVIQHPAAWHTLDDLAKRANLSPRYFSIKFKEIVGKPLQQYVIEARIDRAEHLLYYAGMNVSEVAEALGYKDVYFFSRQYKKFKGMSPSKVR
ncbi:AraC family transcriptional regulator [Longirhabdus pacifica]|uniref:AraC family transcriptional regulator n=1 Tax=Longirhabdus pacifica TaxID=2305227 RepID=UPI001008B285|nr:AraC family transcriptional regulator [Longirhabdus pacifica]